MPFAGEHISNGTHFWMFGFLFDFLKCKQTANQIDIRAFVGSIIESQYRLFDSAHFFVRMFCEFVRFSEKDDHQDFEELPIEAPI